MPCLVYQLAGNCLPLWELYLGPKFTKRDRAKNFPYRLRRYFLGFSLIGPMAFTNRARLALSLNSYLLITPHVIIDVSVKFVTIPSLFINQLDFITVFKLTFTHCFIT